MRLPSLLLSAGIPVLRGLVIGAMLAASFLRRLPAAVPKDDLLV